MPKKEGPENEHPPNQLRDETQRHLVFSLSDSKYSIPLLKVREVIGQTPITPIPRMPGHFRGIMNLRGQVIPVLDLRAKLKLNASLHTEESAIVIVDLAPRSLGVIVDSVDQVQTIDLDQIQAPQLIDVALESGFLDGVAKCGEELVLMLNVQNALGTGDSSLRTETTRQTA